MQLYRFTTKDMHYRRPAEVERAWPAMARLSIAARVIFCLPFIFKWEGLPTYK